MNDQQMPGNYQPGPYQPAGSSLPPNYNPKPPLDPKKKRLIIILAIAGGFLAIILILAVTMAIMRGGKQNAVASPTPTATPSQFEDIVSARTFIGVAPDAKRFELKMTVPANWRASQSSSAINGWPYNIAQFKFLVSSIGSTSAVDGRKKERPQNDITTQNATTISDLSKWLKTDDKTGCPVDVNCGPFGNLRTMADKTKFYEFLNALTPQTKITTRELEFFKPAITPEIGGKQSVSTIFADDGKLKGVAYITNYGSPEAFSPSLIVLMVGKLNERPILFDGRFLIQDKLYQDLATARTSADENYQKNLTKALSDFGAGILSAQAQQIRDEAITAVKTTKLELIN